MKKLLFSLLLALGVVPMTWAADGDISLVIKDHRFIPAEIQVPAGKKVRLMVENKDSTPEEFESHSLNREKLIPAGATVPIYIGPLSAGKYPFFGEFNEKTAQGVVIVK